MEQPQIISPISSLEFKKKEAMQEVFNEIEAIQSEDLGIERLAAVQKLYEEAKGGDYRREQALAKLVEYYRFELESAQELQNRANEIIRIYPEAVGRLGFKEAANDSSFITSDNDQKYNVA